MADPKNPNQKPNPGAPICQEKTGFVILHKCGMPADAQCGSCGKYICGKHTHINAGQPMCEACFKTAAPEEYQKAVGARGRYPHYYGYRPYYYGYYNDSNYTLFNRKDSDSFHESGSGS